MFLDLSNPVKLTLVVCATAIIVALALYGFHKHKA
ncbi:hypothetical protein SDC9_172496 [bioreactor metagenome]|uniref:Uncharacterized protein n=1 Tax=bioreactor metagenome TaxID=1076179 RepID=A0A645GH18_9ZZZZ